MWNLNEGQFSLNVLREVKLPPSTTPKIGSSPGSNITSSFYTITLTANRATPALLRLPG
ncbi:hypothetical protein AVEN_16166-1, partial [Araneus ventricosus]